MKSPVTYRAAVDFLDLQIVTSRTTNAWSIQRLLGDRLPGQIPYVRPLNRGAGGAASVFHIRMHNPSSARSVVGAIRLLEPTIGLALEPELVALEVAFDTYLACGDRDELARIALDRCRWSQHTPNQDWHLYRERGRTYLNELSIRQAQDRLAEGWNAADSATKDVDVRYHAYVKVMDAGQPLPRGKWRARFEVTLRGGALPCSKVSDLPHLDCRTLAPLFRFQKYADEAPHPAIAYGRRGLMAGVQLGARGSYPRRISGRVAAFRRTDPLQFRSWTAADRELNDAVYAEFRRLHRRWRGE